MLLEDVVALAVRSLETRGEELVLDIVNDSDLDAPPLQPGPRRLRFARAGLAVDVLVHESGPGDPRQVLLRVTPPRRCLVRAVSRGRDLTVEGARGRTDHGGVTRLVGLPRGITSLRVETALPGESPARTAWVRL